MLGFLLSLLLCVSIVRADLVETPDGEESEYLVGGPRYAKQFDRECEAVARMLTAGNNRISLFANAFFDGQGKSVMCLQVFGEDGDTPEQMIYHITDRQGNLLEALVAPASSSAVPLVECNIWNVDFEDYNGDTITDILLGIGCFDPASQKGTGDSVVYLSTESEDLIWLRQRQDVNKAIASLPDYAKAGEIIREVINGGFDGGVGSSAAAADTVTTCTYETSDGPEVVTYNNASGAVIGSLAKSGTIAGIRNASRTRGVWSRGGKQGDFELTHESGGYAGKWKYAGDAQWRGQWQGRTVNCE